ncbi:hypothetical protein LTR37_016111 [Vermiconidia calcicola]|uniref:Uncharacterized protein n=1 Tax=Vermiconidia calcicola TaxID=1690605 RepID=A0ACC3MQ76_9PEZI|nr:hypothetical protein LTR37_016111 [Vermiconidia calcicola]
MSAPTEGGYDIRKRKTHRKSRKGCGNCKLRRVKCDEAHPQCEKCIAYGVTCNYDGDATDELQLPGEGAFTFISQPHQYAPAAEPESAPKDSLSPEGWYDKVEGMLGMPLELHDIDEPYYVTEADVEAMRNFRDKTVWTIGTAQTVRFYRNEMMKMIDTVRFALPLTLTSIMLTPSPKFPYVVHITLSLSMMHTRYITSRNPWTTTPSAKEIFHHYHGTALFNRLLSQPLEDSHRDPLWGTAALLGCITIGSIEARTAEEAWPLKRSSPEDLDWLRMSDGKKEVWRIVDPLREDSVWRHALDYGANKDPLPYDHRVPELDLLYPWLIKIYDFDPSSSEHNEDPYYTAASILVRLLELDCNHSTIMYFLSFLGHMDVRFRQLLHDKDPKALLLLSWWYGKMCQYNVWWQSRRMVLEGQAICLYLERNHADDPDVLRLLSYPRMMTGLIQS